MTDETQAAEGIETIELYTRPTTVDAGAPVAAKVRIVTEPVRDLRGETVAVTDAAGTRLGAGRLTTYDGIFNESETITVSAPEETGSYTLLAEPPESLAGATAPARTAITVTPHTTRLVVGEIPSAVVAGRSCPVKVGVKCSSECALAGTVLTVRDGAGATVAEAHVSETIWPGTRALYTADIAVTAPETPGLYSWTVTAGGTAIAGLGHAPAEAAMPLRVEPPPDHTVTIDAVDAETQTAIPGLTVVMHPYRARTDESGRAHLAVPAGDYTAYVSGRGYYPVRRALTVNADTATTAELKAEPPPSKDW